MRQLPPARNRVAEVAERIADQIEHGRFAPGERLPTEQAMMSAMGVSRTVIREAVAALRAEGLVVTRQGLGAFVAADRTHQPFRIAPEDVATVHDVLEVMEVRLAVETETAGLAAERAEAAQLDAVTRALAAIQEAIGRGESAADEDMAFHFAVARASGNSQFARLLEYLGRFIVPRHAVRTMTNVAADRLAYMNTFQSEHLLIEAAIRRRDPAAARTAMRTHLTNSQTRYRSLAGAAGV